MNFLNGKFTLTDLPLEKMRFDLIKLMFLFGATFIGGSSYLIFSYIKNYNKIFFVKLALISPLLLYTLKFFSKWQSKVRFLVYKIDLAEDGKHIYLTHLNRLCKFYERKVPIETIKIALEQNVPSKYFVIGNPFLIDKDIYVLPRNIFSLETDSEYKKEILEAIFKGVYIYTGTQEEKEEELTF